MSSAQNDSAFLIAEYALGLLGAQDTAQAHALLGSDHQAAIDALQWEDRFLALADHLPPVTPSAGVLLQIQTTLGHDTTVPLRPSAAQPAHAAPAATPAPQAAAQAFTQPAAHKPAPSPRTATEPAAPAHGKANRLWANLWLWRAATVALALALAVPALVPDSSGTPAENGAAPADAALAAEPAPPRAAILQAPGQTSTPGWIVTFDASGDLLLTPKVAIEVPEDAAVYLWTRGDTEAPRLLAALNPNSPATLPFATLGPLEPGQIFEMTQEVRGETPPLAPKGPILFIGRLVTLG